MCPSVISAEVPNLAITEPQPTFLLNPKPINESTKQIYKVELADRRTMLLFVGLLCVLEAAAFTPALAVPHPPVSPQRSTADMLHAVKARPTQSWLHKLACRIRQDTPLRPLLSLGRSTDGSLTYMLSTPSDEPAERANDLMTHRMLLHKLPSSGAELQVPPRKKMLVACEKLGFGFRRDESDLLEDLFDM